MYQAVDMFVLRLNSNAKCNQFVLQQIDIFRRQIGPLPIVYFKDMCTNKDMRTIVIVYRKKSPISSMQYVMNS